MISINTLKQAHSVLFNVSEEIIEFYYKIYGVYIMEHMEQFNNYGNIEINRRLKLIKRYLKIKKLMNY